MALLLIPPILVVPPSYNRIDMQAYAFIKILTESQTRHTYLHQHYLVMQISIESLGNTKAKRGPTTYIYPNKQSLVANFMEPVGSRAVHEVFSIGNTRSDSSRFR